MASPRPALVASVSDPEPGVVAAAAAAAAAAESAPATAGSRPGFGAAVRAWTAAAVVPLTPQANSPAPSEYNYESPNEDSQPAFFSQPQQPQPQQQQRHRQRQQRLPEQQHSNESSQSRPQRPALVSRPSQMVSFAPPSSPLANSNGSNLDNVVSSAHLSTSGRKIGIKDRIACYRWTYFTMTMATGGVANVLFSLPFTNDWLTGIGIFFMMLNICLFLLNCVMISMRFYLRPGSFINSFTDQYESLFIPAFFVSLAVIMINICQYGTDHVGNWLLRTMEIMFWIYAAVCVFASAGIYLVLWSTLIFPVHTMTPTWVFPAYPLLLTGPFASQLIAASQRSPHLGLAINSTAVALTAVTIQGTGCLIAFMISAAFIYRLMTQKLPRDTQRPGVFMSIGPFGFTAGSITQLGNQASVFIPPDFLDSPYTIDVFRIISVLVGLWLWGLAVWFFLISVGSLWKYARAGSSMPFQMTWWSFVFPNTALITATGTLGEIFQNRGMQIATSVMAAAIIVVWIAVFLTMLRCLKNKTLLWPKNDT